MQMTERKGFLGINNICVSYGEDLVTLWKTPQDSEFCKIEKYRFKSQVATKKQSEVCMTASLQQ